MDPDNTPSEFAKLTKGQKKALKAKQKKEAAAKAAAEGAASDKTKEDAKEAPATKGGAKGKGKGKGKKKGPPGGIASHIKKQLAEQREAEEAQKAEEERLKQEALEIQRKKEEKERKIKEEAERIERERIEEIRKLKKEGKWLSKKEREKKEAQEEARRQLIAQGLIDEDAFAQKEETPKQRVVYSKKKRGKGKKNQHNNEKKEDNKEEEQKQEEEKVEEPKHNVQPGLEEDPADFQKATENQEAKEIDEDLVVDDWEMLDDENVIEDQVKLQNDAAPAPKVEVEEMPESTEELATNAEPKVSKSKEESKIAPSDKKKDKKKEAGSGGGSIFVRKGGKRKAKKGVVKEEFKNASDELRCPIICVLGHVDTGKTLLLDKIRRTNVQRGEAGGITQQIGATYFPGEALQKNVDKLDDDFDIKKVEIPGLLVIDTPGHESFTNLRSRGSNLCDLAILVVDVMHGLEQQTLESIDLLKKRRTPFIVALNKIDRNHGWEPEEYRSSKIALDAQDSQVLKEYETRRDQSFLQFNELGMNIIEYWNNEDTRTYISAVPTSAMTGEGIPDILGMVVKYTQKILRNKILQNNTEFQCTVLEVKKIPGVGTTVDVVLVNGEIHVGDTIVLAGFNGPIITKIRALLTPQPMKEIRVKGDYVHHDVLYGAMGIKISAPDLDNALAGGELYRAENADQIDELCDEISENMFNFAEKYVNPSEEGVCVQASTLGSLEALLEFLKSSKIPVCNVNIGSIYKKDVMKALKAITGEKTHKEFATILAFDVKIDPDAREYADENGIKIFEADIIYHLFDQFTDYVKECEEERKEDEGVQAVFPCVLEIIKDNIFHSGGPMLLGMNVLGGVLKVGTPLCCPDKNNLKVGVVTGIQRNKKDVTEARPADGGVSVKINNAKHVHAGKQFTEANQLASMLNRKSIDALKTYYKDEMTKADWKLVIRLKEVLGVE